MTMERVTTEEPTTTLNDLALSEPGPAERGDQATSQSLCAGARDDGNDEAKLMSFVGTQEKSDDEESFAAWLDSLKEVGDGDGDGDSILKDIPEWTSILKEYALLHSVPSHQLKTIAWKLQADLPKTTDALSVERFAEKVLEVYLDLIAYTSAADDNFESGGKSACYPGRSRLPG